MASLNTLRTKFGLVLSILIGLVLVAFILGDQLSMQNRGGDMPEDATVMTVNGEEIKASQYAEYHELYRGSYGTEDQKTEFAKQHVIFDNFTHSALEAIGLGVAEEDIKAYATIFGQQMASQNIGMPADQVKTWIQNTWDNQLPTVDVELGYQKFAKAYAAANYVNRLEVEADLRAKNLTFDGRYVMVPYTAMPEVAVTEAEINAYYEANKVENNKYGARTLHYVTFEIAPSAEDYKAVAEQVMAADKAVKAANGDANEIKKAVRTIGGKSDKYQLLSSLDSKVIDAVEAGNNYGPVFENDAWVATYVISDVKAASSYEFEVATVENLEKANELVEALKAVGGDFTKLDTAVDTTTDTRLMANMTQSEAKDFIGRKVGDIVVISYNHKSAVAKITKLGDVERYVLTADVNKSVKASEKTNSAIVKSVESFEAAAGVNLDSFVKAANENGYHVLSGVANRNDYMAERGVSGMANSRNIAVWAYGAQVGDKKYFYGENLIHVVMVTSINENKYEPKNSVAIENTLKRDKQYEAIASKLAMGATIEGAVEGEFSNIKFNDVFVDGQYEPALVGAIARSRETGVEAKVKGDKAAFVFVVDAINGEVNPETFETERIPLMTQREEQMFGVSLDALTNKAEVEDMRGEGQL